jgi:chromosomal replication initiator protein
MPENSSARLAIDDVLERLVLHRSSGAASPLYIHGRTGIGKTHLVYALAEEVARRVPQAIVWRYSAVDFIAQAPLIGDRDTDSCDLFVLEDLQRWVPAASRLTRPLEQFVQLFDQLQARECQMVFTATVGPGQLDGIPARLVHRLGSGLVVGIDPPGAQSRLKILQDKAQRRQLAVAPEVLVWLARHLPGGIRQLEGAVLRLEMLARASGRQPDLSSVAALFREQSETNRPTVERVAERVGHYFQVDVRHLQSRRRYRQLALPRQMSMYLARRLTGLSLDQIGAFFGGRDHSTVLHACRKLEKVVRDNATVASAVKEIQSDFV